MTMFKRVSVIVMLAIYLVLIPVFFRGSQYVLHVFIMCSQLSIVSLTVRVVFNVGELSFGQVVFVMAGAYASAILSIEAGLAFLAFFTLVWFNFGGICRFNWPSDFQAAGNILFHPDCDSDRSRETRHPRVFEVSGWASGVPWHTQARGCSYRQIDLGTAVRRYR